MTDILLDTGPLVAYLSERDRFHVWARECFGKLAPPLLTCEPVLTEAVYLLGPGGQRALEMLGRKAIELAFSLKAEATAVRSLMQRYRSRRGRSMGLADACLVRMSELRAECLVLTVDRDFRDVYRRNGRQVIPAILPPRRP